MLFYKFTRQNERTSLALFFQNKGDRLEMHTHLPFTHHDLRVDCGSVLIYGPENKWSLEARAGDFITLLEAQQEHEIMALEDKTFIANVYKTSHVNPETLIGNDWAPYE